MSTTTSSVSSTSTACTANVYQLPTTDAACAAVNTGNMTTVFDTCCKGNSPVKYENDCGIYCLAQEQTVEKLLSCLQTTGNNYRDVFCNDKLNATATAKATTTASETGTKTETSSTSTTTSTKNAAAGQPVSTMGLGVLAMVLFSGVMGVFA
ncbi:uncharacterized protein N7484_007950 [Penicillium longicatenatum]|uniref:uncharacterized protein n=1 Tax=Penicillium longicatenatum TaxID=1561947 RepID=UPI002546986E|nr:uncharacterized protein N7484_007950 [Penicillium longicatenatum]KAJ5640088.1 hypothetical protein N7484_007950 [Penicillium longicatenatum]KAJ5652779.1 hypothetical protein N7507_010205 [Penicillium longicatenatum]